MGNEGSGISEKVKAKINKYIHLDINNVESLNVAVATSIILYELNK
jgi:tRNA G18 (ribose-2'-O)-methylase SpoU